MISEYYQARSLAVPTFLHEWTDGCACQYKCAAAFHDIGSLGVPCCRNFFATAHAKGEQDSAGGLVKTACRRACFNKQSPWYNRIVDVDSMYEFCNAELTGPPSTRSGSRDARKTLNRMFFHLVKAGDVKREGRPQVKTLKGKQNLRTLLLSSVTSFRGFSVVRIILVLTQLQPATLKPMVLQVRRNFTPCDVTVWTQPTSR